MFAAIYGHTATAAELVRLNEGINAKARVRIRRSCTRERRRKCVSGETLRWLCCRMAGLRFCVPLWLATPPRSSSSFASARTSMRRALYVPSGGVCAFVSTVVCTAAGWLYGTDAGRALRRHCHGRRARPPGRKSRRAGHGKGSRSLRRSVLTSNDGTHPCWRVANQFGNTALINSARNGLTGTVTELVRLGANMEAKDMVRSAAEACIDPRHLSGRVGDVRGNAAWGSSRGADACAAAWLHCSSERHIEQKSCHGCRARAPRRGYQREGQACGTSPLELPAAWPTANAAQRAGLRCRYLTVRGVQFNSTALEIAKRLGLTEIVELLTRATVRARRTQRSHAHGELWRAGCLATHARIPCAHTLALA
jgi:hypothetical protein